MQRVVKLHEFKYPEFKYPGSTKVPNKCTRGVKKRAQAGWSGWRRVLGDL